ncbi:MAG TPA: S53 family peptidase [Candidatus Acidoferrales bacterium]|nr:S53 family peptidase [Candidatus Acidoferrales bacterium]
MTGNLPEEAAEFASEPAAPTGRTLTMHVAMALRSRAELDRLLEDQQNPASPDYHRWLTSAEFSARFGPGDSDIAKVTDWLKRQGFKVTSVNARARDVAFTGTVAKAQNAFRVRIAATADGALYASLNEPSVPAALAGLIDSIHGLDNLLRSAPARRLISTDAGSSSPDAHLNGFGNAFGPGDMATFYDSTPLLNQQIDGHGTCIAIAEDSNLDRSGADAFNAHFGLPAFNAGNFQTVLADGTDPGVTSDGIEAMVDVNYSHAAAPGAKIVVYVGDPNNSNSGSGLLDAILLAVNDDECGAISISFSFCGAPHKFYKQLGSMFAQGAALGQSIFVSTGDEGAAGLVLSKAQHACVTARKATVNELAGAPQVTAIGGTQFTPNFDGNGNDVGSVAESAWNDASGATGGGRSKVFKKPQFQAGLFPKDKKRDLPDISLGASPLSPGFFFGDPATEFQLVGGTSIGAPYWAGISQLIAQSTGDRVGNINTRLYQLGAMANPGVTGIRDVTSGSNSFGNVAGFNAGPGFDKATGWGTVDIGLFVPAYIGR